MKNFNWEKFKKGYINIHCDTEEKANDFLKECHNKGITWNGGSNLLDHNNWDMYKENTCYDHNDNGLCYCDLYFTIIEDYKTIEWEI